MTPLKPWPPAKSSLAIGANVSGATADALLATDGSGDLASGEPTSSVVIAGSTGTLTGAVSLITSATALTANSRYMMDATAGTFIVTLPPSPPAGAILDLEATTFVGKVVTIAGNGALIEGASGMVLGPRASQAVFKAVTLQFDGFEWRIIDSTRNGWLYPQDYAGAGCGPLPLLPAPTDLSGVATIYIDSQGGSDSNAGTYAAPYATLAHGVATAQGLAAGSTVALKCGSVFRESLPCPVSGSSGSQITIGQYGQGARPKIKGSLDYSNLSWSVYSGSIYQATVSLAAGATVFIDETTALAKVSSLAGLTSPGEWYYSGTILYIWMYDGSSPAGHQIEMPGHVSTICNSGAHGYWTIQDVAWMHAGTGLNGVYINAPQSGWEIRRCQAGPLAGIADYGAGTQIHDNYVFGGWDGIEYPNGAAIAGIAAGGTSNGRIYRNRVTDCHYGIRAVQTDMSVTIDHNLVYLNHVNGIDNDGGTGTINVYNNTVHHRPTGTSTGAGHGIDQQSGGSGITVKNNIIYSDFSGVSGQNVEAICFEGAPTASDYNLIYIVTPQSGQACYPGKYGTTGGDVNNTGIYSTWAGFKTASSTDSDSIFGSDPLFMDVASDDYRLQPGSPAIGTATAIAGVTNATGVNIGAL